MALQRDAKTKSWMRMIGLCYARYCEYLPRMGINIQFKRLRADAVAPKYMSEHAAGLDLSAAVDGEISILPGKCALIGTGLSIELPHGHEAQIRPRSGLAFKHGVTVLNSPGTIDADYRGEVKVLLINHGEEPFVVKPGERIAQMVVARVEQAQFTESTTLTDTTRGAGGYGHTGT